MIATAESRCIEPVDANGRAFKWGEGTPHWKDDAQAAEHIAAIRRMFEDDGTEPPALTTRHVDGLCWHLSCDECGYRFDEEEWVSHFPSREDIDETLLSDYEWAADGDRHLCPACNAELTPGPDTAGIDSGPAELC